MTLRELVGSKWVGRSELWLDPAGNEAITCDCTVTINADSIDYTWSYEGKPHTGKVALRAGGADFTDTWHATTMIPMTTVADSWCLVDVKGTYKFGDSPEWGWRIYLSHRPESDELVLQMTNITHWGEDGRAVRKICKRA